MTDRPTTFEQDVPASLWLLAFALGAASAAAVLILILQRWFET